jgi:lambda repressor-like predicted transcriptional regulator
MNDSLESKINGYITKRGIQITSISKKTGINRQALYNSLRKNRKLRVEEFFLICQFLEINPLIFLSKKEN